MSRDRIYFIAPTTRGALGWRVVPVVEHGRYHSKRPATWRGPFASEKAALYAIHDLKTAKAEPRHPVTDEPTNAARALRVDAALTAYTTMHYGADGENVDIVVQDFLTDVFHWAHRHDVLPGDVAQRAANMFQTEVDQERANDDEGGDDEGR